MGIFGRKTGIELLEDELCRLRRRVEDLETAEKRLKLEWNETYDKISHQVARLSKRLRDATGSNSIELSSVQEPDSSTGSDGLDPISRKILARRGALPPGK